MEGPGLAASLPRRRQSQLLREPPRPLLSTPSVDPFDPALPARRPQSADEWVGALGGRRFMGGDAPDLADLAMFGVVRAVAGTNTFNDLMQVGCRVLGRWAGGRAGRAAAWQALGGRQRLQPLRPPPLRPAVPLPQNSAIGGWYERMFEAVGESSCINDVA